MDTYEKNLKSLEKNRPDLCKKLRKIESNDRFDVFLAKGDAYANILDRENNFLFYDDAQKAIEKNAKEYEKYREYLFLYFFGIADGKNIEKLLENEKLHQLFVIEADVELIYIAFNLIDFSKDLQNNRLVVLDYEEIDYSLLINMIHISNAKYYIRNFKLIINGSYYEQFYIEKYKTLLTLFLKAINYVAQANGNDINDTFRGFRQHIQNLNLMLENGKYQSLLKKEFIKTAVIISTGPSLDKQLPLLKKYQDKVAILSVDASFPILIKHGIKPDFVFTMERDEPTAQFFQEIDEKDQKDVIIVSASLQHKVLFESLKSDSIFVVMRPFAYNTYLDLHDYGYLCKGMSSANMAHEFSSAFGFKNTILIGQDLAFGEDFKTHADDHIIESNALLDDAVKNKNYIEVEAYGGSGVVYSNIYWNMFRNFIEHHIEETNSFMTTYNATEGGSRIIGSKEVTFKEILEKLAKEKKIALHVDKVDLKEIEKLKLDTKKKLHSIKEQSLALQKQINDSFLLVAKECEQLENKSVEEAVEVLSMEKTIYLLEEISKIRKKIDASEIYTKFLTSIIQPLMYSMELEIADIKVIYVDNAKDNQIKALQWILAHRFWLFSLSGVIENVIHIIDETEAD